MSNTTNSETNANYNLVRKIFYYGTFFILFYALREINLEIINSSSSESFKLLLSNFLFLLRSIELFILPIISFLLFKCICKLIYIFISK